MEDLIMKIIDIEAQAQEIIKDAKTADDNLEADIYAETEKLHKEIENKAAAKTETIKKLEDDEAEKKIKEIREKTNSTIAALNNKYSENKDEWVKKIIDGIIG